MQSSNVGLTLVYITIHYRRQGWVIPSLMQFTTKMQNTGL